MAELFHKSYPYLVRFLTENSRNVQSLAESIENETSIEANALHTSEYFHREAIRRFIPNWSTMERLSGTEALRQSIVHWAKQQNLTDLWCLDHALAFLRQFESQDGKAQTLSLLPYRGYLDKLISLSWTQSTSDLRSSALYTQYQVGAFAEDLKLYSFKFHYEHLSFSVSGPFYKRIPEFKSEVLQEFREVGGDKVPGARKILELRLQTHLENPQKFKTQQSLRTPPLRLTNEHFDWLVVYQLLPSITYRGIAREVGKRESTVREGIRRVADLIGLTLRSPEHDKYPGRPKGSRDNLPRHRATRI